MLGVRGGAVLAALALLLACAAPASAAPRPGERYDGLSATGQRIFVTVSKNGRRLGAYVFWVRTSCTDGRRRLQGLLAGGEGPTRIRADGSFRHRSKAWRGSYPTRSGRAHGRLRLSFSGAFDAAGDVVTGTIRANFRSRRFNCSSGPVGFTLHRDGSAGAPWQDAVMATGLYRGSGSGLGVQVRALAPGRELILARFRYRAGCRGGGRLRSTWLFRRYLIADDGTRNFRVRDRFRIRHDNVTVRARLRLSLRFFQQDGYRVDGLWRLRAVVFRGGRRIDSCAMRSPFTGSFVRGPA